MTSEQKFEFGRFGENIVAHWLRSRGNSILPIRDIEMGEAYKGPRMTTPNDIELVCTDWLAINQNNGQTTYIEVKTKSAFTWHRNTREWVTGIDQRYLDHYLLIRQKGTIPMWLLFVHLNDQPSSSDSENGAPSTCPCGLFGAEILTLAEKPHHTHSNWGKGGMVYWAIPPLAKLATLAELKAISERCTAK